jgi:hypothetical protein
MNPIFLAGFVRAAPKAGRKTAAKVEQKVCPHSVRFLSVCPLNVLEIPPANVGNDQVPICCSQARWLCGTIVGIRKGDSLMVVGTTEMVAVAVAQFLVGASEPASSLAMEVS